MSGKKILALVLAIVVGVILVKIVFALISITFSLIGWLIPIAIGGVIVYALYRGFNYMLDNGKRLT